MSQKTNETNRPVEIQLPESAVDIASLTLDSIVLVTALILAVTKRRLSSIIKTFKEAKASKTPFDKNQKTKMQIHGYLSALRVLANCDYACFGLLHNGSFTEWGYSFSSVTWELESTDENLQPLIPKLKDYPITSWLTSSSTWFTSGTYSCYPIKLGSTQVGIIALGCYDCKTAPKINSNDAQEVIKEIVETIMKTFINEVT